MKFDLSLFVNIVDKLLAAVLGALVLRFFERRARLVAFYSHVGAFRTQFPGQNPGDPPNVGWVNTHSVVIRNTGRLSANHVRVPHAVRLASPGIHVSVDPDTGYNRHDLPGGGEEFEFESLVPGQQVTISYLYFPPLTVNLINMPIRSDEGMARALNVLPTPQPPIWWVRLFWLLALVGVVMVIYFGIQAGLWIKALL